LHRNGVTVSPWALATLLVLVLGSASFNWIYHLRVVDRLDRIETKQQECDDVLTSKWTSGGIEREWTSTLGEHDPDETLKELAKRHKRELAELQEELPIDKPDDGE
tara:strand:+ start:35139 stop:35456 length:318 start_codon:yes stop_codon:yes gene_type:complete